MDIYSFMITKMIRKTKLIGFIHVPNHFTLHSLAFDAKVCFLVLWTNSNPESVYKTLGCSLVILHSNGYSTLLYCISLTIAHLQYPWKRENST
jgi:hypothetical protein